MRHTAYVAIRWWRCWNRRRCIKANELTCKAPVLFARRKSTVVLRMVNRTNYHLVKEYLRYLTDVQQLDSKSIGRYWFYLRYLLLWADELPISALSNHRPTFPTYLASARRDEKDQPLAPTTMKKIVQTAKRFLTWLKLTYPREYRNLSSAWIGQHIHWMKSLKH